VTVLSEHEEEPGITLEEQIKILQEQNLPKEKIVQQIFEEDLNANIDVLSKSLGMGKLDIGRIKGRISRLKKIREDKEKPREEAPPGAKESVYKTELDVNSILEGILSRHPDVNPKVKEEVMDWAKMKGGLQPTELVYILQSMRGITTVTANIIASKYSFALNKAVQEGGGKLQLPPVFGVQATQTSVQPQFLMQPFFQQPFQQQQQQGPGMVSGQPAPTGYGPPPPSDTRSIVREELRLALGERAKEPGSEQFVDIYEPIKNEEGQVIVNEDGQPMMKHIRVPVSQAAQFAPREDAEERVLKKLKEYKAMFGSELTEAKIREIVRQEAPQPAAVPETPPITAEDVHKAAVDAAAAAVKEVKDEHEREKKEDERFKHLEDTIRQTTSARTVEGYKEDSFRILGQGLSEAATTIKDRKPIEVIVKEGGRILFPGAPGEKVVEPGAGQGIFERLRNRGWVTEQ